MSVHEKIRKTLSEFEHVYVNIHTRQMALFLLLADEDGQLRSKVGEHLGLDSGQIHRHTLTLREIGLVVTPVKKAVPGVPEHLFLSGEGKELKRAIEAIWEEEQ